MKRGTIGKVSTNKKKGNGNKEMQMQWLGGGPKESEDKEEGNKKEISTCTNKERGVLKKIECKKRMKRDMRRLG